MAIPFINLITYILCSKYGEIEEMNVCDNLGDHLVGNVYIKYRREEDAEKACKVLNTRWYDGMYRNSIFKSAFNASR